MCKTAVYLFKALILLFFSVPALSKGTSDVVPQIPDTVEAFRSVIKKTYQFTGPDYNQPLGKNKRKYLDLKKGELLYLPINWMLPGQGTYSFLSVAKKIKTAPQEWEAVWGAHSQEWQLANDSGKAIYPASKSALVLLLADGALVLDGNHKVLTSLYFGSQTVPAKIAKNWSHLTLAEAMPKLIKKDFVFPYNAKGDWLSPSELPDYLTIEDNPLRFLASQVLLKCQVQMSDSQNLQILNLRGSTSPIICKLNRDIPFLELHMARMWQLLELNYDPAQEVTPELLEKARDMLLQEFNKTRLKYPFLKKVLLVDTPFQIESVSQPSEGDITKLESIIKSYLLGKGAKTCQNLLKDLYF